MSPGAARRGGVRPTPPFPIGRDPRGWASLRSQARTVGEVQVHDADASSEPGCSRDQKQSCPDSDGPDGSRDALTGWCETFDGDGCRHDRHRAKVRDPNDQEDRHQTGTAVAAVEAEAQAVSPGRAGVRRQRTAAPRYLPAAGKVMCLPRGELARAGAGCCISIAARRPAEKRPCRTRS
jgi:hypothetical protein